MSKKMKRISWLVGIRNAINNTEMSADGKCVYDVELIKNVLATIDDTLKLDGIHAVNANERVGVTTLTKQDTK